MNMKKSLLFLVAATAPALAADIPRLIPHEGRLLRADGTPERGIVRMQFAIYTVPTAGSPTWSETHTVQPSQDGYYAVLLGAQRALPDFSGDSYWLGVQVVGEPEMEPRTRLVSVPFAVRAAQAENAAAVGGTPAANVLTTSSTIHASNVSGGPLNVTSLQIGGATVIDSSGQMTGPLLASVPKRGVLFTRWGRIDCPAGTSLVYAGFAAGSWYTHGGSGANHLCLSRTPTWDVYNDGDQNGALVYGLEYEMSGYGLASALGGLHDHDAPCAVCLDPAADLMFMHPGSQECPAGWNTRYQGYLMSTHYTQSKSEYVCVDRAPQTDPLSTSADHNGKLWYPTEAECGSLKCGPYVQNRELTCSVCTR